MIEYQLNQHQARFFQLLKHGLIGPYRFQGKDGICDFIKQAGCIQFDPIDVCGKNAEIVLQSRIKAFRKTMLSELLYEDRCLIDYFDKNLAIMPIEDWKNFQRIQKYFQSINRSQDQINSIREDLLQIIKVKGYVSSKDLEFNDKVNWFWSDTKLSRAALESLYFQGELVIHHKKGPIKFYSLASDTLPPDIFQAKEPFIDEFDYLKWRVRRRISSVGFLWNKASDAWLFIQNLNASKRNEIFDALIKEGQLIKLHVEGIKEDLYCLASDEALLKEAIQEVNIKPRMEFIAPLDSFLWDRKLIKALYQFDYKWEIYTPEKDRKYGYYVLPILYGTTFIGRIEVIHQKKEHILQLKNLWLEEGIELNHDLRKKLQTCLERFSTFHGCEKIDYLIKIS